MLIFMSIVVFVNFNFLPKVKIHDGQARALYQYCKEIYLSLEKEFN